MLICSLLVHQMFLFQFFNSNTFIDVELFDYFEVEFNDYEVSGLRCFVSFSKRYLNKINGIDGSLLDCKMCDR